MNRKCAQCGEVYRQGNGHQGKRFCSRDCERAHQAARRAERTRTCAWCLKPFTPKNPGTIGTGKFCSQNCWRLKTKFHSPPKVDSRPCASCGRPVVRSPNQKIRYCSRDCQATARVRLESEKSRGPGWRKLAEEIRERDGRRCRRCGEPESNRRHPVDHIVPWVLVKKRPEIANDPVNLATLCISCHGVKTTVTEPRLLAGDFLALLEFYGRPTMEQAYRTLELVDAA